MNVKGIKNKILRFKRIFTEHWPSFVKTHPRYDTDYYQAEVSKMLTCGSEAGGFAIFQCLRCGEDERKVHFSCKGKACPQCGKRYARDSMIKIAARLYPGVDYRQIVLTLPEQLRRPFYNHPNQQKLYSKFMALAQPCLEELIHGLFKNTEYKAATIVFLHTNGRNGSYNPHLHVIVAEGAFHPIRKEWRTFNYQSHRTKSRAYETITVQTFIDRMVQHIPLTCKHCGTGMDLVRLYHPDRGVFYDLLAYD